jgi:DNA-binding response OmpR family regulator
MRVLVVEDEKKIAAFILKGLAEAGFNPLLCASGDDALDLAITERFDAIVLDVMLPGRDGLSILRQLRAKSMSVPVVLVTARSALDERLDGLNLGADDYLTKPFYVEELIARLHAVLRRASGHQASILQHGELSVNLLTREVRCASALVELTAREFALLTYLLRSPGQTFTRAQICEHVWNYHFDPGTNLVDVYVQHVRKKLGDLGPALIETIRGVGYRVRPETSPATGKP